MKTVKQLLQSAATKLGLALPVGIVGSSDATAKVLLSILHEVGDDLALTYSWDSLIKEGAIYVEAEPPFSLSAFPSDARNVIAGTVYLGTRKERVRALSLDEFQAWRRGGYSVADFSYRLTASCSTGSDSDQYIGNGNDSGPFTPTFKGPDYVYFNYYSTRWLDPFAKWKPDIAVYQNTKLCSEGHIYTVSLVTGTSQTTKKRPTHLYYGSVADAEEPNILYKLDFLNIREALSDSDLVCFDDALVEAGVVCKYLETKGLDSAVPARARFERLLEALQNHQRPGGAFRITFSQGEAPDPVLAARGWFNYGAS